jgi:hypothetical protein
VLTNDYGTERVAAAGAVSSLSMDLSKTTFENPMQDGAFENAVEESTEAERQKTALFFESEEDGGGNGRSEVTTGKSVSPTRAGGEATSTGAKSGDRMIKAIRGKRTAVPESAEMEDGTAAGGKWSTDFFQLFMSALQRRLGDWDPIRDLFHTVDKDGSGDLDLAEVKMMLRKKLKTREIETAFAEMDEDDSGTIDVEEFKEWWDVNVVDPAGHYHFHLADLKREDLRSEMKKCFAISAADLGRQLKVDAFFAIIEKHTAIKLADDQQIALLAQICEHKEMGSPSDQASVEDFLEWWDHFFQFDYIDPFKAALSKLSTKHLISPLSSFRADWDVTQLLMLLYIAITLPYRIGFFDGVRLWSFWFFVDAIIDLYFIADLFINMRTAVITGTGQILHGSRDIVWNCKCLSRAFVVVSRGEWHWLNVC